MLGVNAQENNMEISQRGNARGKRKSLQTSICPLGTIFFTLPFKIFFR